MTPKIKFEHVLLVWVSVISVWLTASVSASRLVSPIRHPVLPSPSCSGLPPVSLELQWPGGRADSRCRLRRARHPLWLYLAWHRAHRWQALLHLGPTQVCNTKGNAAGSHGQETQGTDNFTISLFLFFFCQKLPACILLLFISLYVKSQ